MGDIRNKIMEHALPLVPFDGWSLRTLREAAKRAGFKESDVKRAFPGGAGECVAYFLAGEDKALEEMFPPEKLAGMRIPERIETLILAKLARWRPRREAIRRTVSFHSLPWNAVPALKALYNTVDHLWRLAGDTSTDFSFYTRRMTLAAVYSSTLLFWLNDVSEGAQETAQFLKRRLGDVAGFGRLKKKLRCA